MDIDHIIGSINFWTYSKYRRIFIKHYLCCNLWNYNFCNRKNFKKIQVSRVFSTALSLINLLNMFLKTATCVVTLPQFVDKNFYYCYNIFNNKLNK